MDDSSQNQAQDSESTNQDPELIPLSPAVNESSESEAGITESSQQVPTGRKRALAHILHSDSDQESDQDDIENPKEGELLACSEDSEEYTTVKGEFFCKKYCLTIMPLTCIIPIYRKEQKI